MALSDFQRIRGRKIKKYLTAPERFNFQGLGFNMVNSIYTR
jgi:hypothetical protein